MIHLSVRRSFCPIGNGDHHLSIVETVLSQLFEENWQTNSFLVQFIVRRSETTINQALNE